MRDLLLTLGLLLLGSSGCATVSNLVHGTPTTDEVVRLTETRDYDRALAVLERLHREAPDSSLFVEMESDIRTEAERDTREEVLRAAEKEQMGDWEGARETLREARRRYSGSDSLASAINGHEARREALARTVETRLALFRARGLLAELPRLEELRRVRYEDRGLRRRLENTREELQDLHEILILASEESLAEGRTEMADEYLTEAARISPSRVVMAALEQLRRPEPVPEPPAPEQAVRGEVVRPVTPVQPRTRPVQPDPKELAARALEAAQEAFSRNDLPLARNHLDRAEQLDPDNEQVLRLKVELQSRVAGQVARLDEAGRRAYVGGHYETAAENWKRAAELEPGNESIRQQLERVERVLENLRRLRGEEVRPPPKFS